MKEKMTFPPLKNDKEKMTKTSKDLLFFKKRNSFSFIIKRGKEGEKEKKRNEK